ncbi:MAG: DUF5684 domain-containing protein [Candidatus Microbacterium phytovorans]|uniref:DUF5684 domain-containing protein n=1 Tax=Candidatus Microbacterium phytovorans TaxID=3121374 RepID=A0AAJ6B444_9MICO|nr:DUF5684 domain-containing protein [Microbacterium sp.]WEK14810.1 MAG: DUF5684 domain-containing protein [Microbacterium sp.]
MTGQIVAAEQMAGAIGFLAVTQAIVAVGVYVWIALALTAVFRKAGAAPWKAWVPVLNAWTLFELAGMRGWWAAVIAGGAIVVGGGAVALSGILGAAALEASFGGDPGGAQAALAAAAAFPALLWLVVFVPALILQIRMLLGVNRGFGLGVGHTVLGVLLFPVWASIVGWGSARWLGPGAAAASAPPQAAMPVAPSAPVVPALADFTARPAPAPAFGDTPVFGSAPAFGGNGAFEAPSTPPAFSAGTAPSFGAPSRPAPNPWAPPGATTGGPAPASTSAGVGAPATAPTSTPPSAAGTPASAFLPAPAPAAQSPSAPATGEVEERTVLAGRRLPAWSLVLPGGDTVGLRGDAVVLGRNPVAPARAPQAQPVAVDDVTRTVSKTHALLTLTASGWIVTDLDSTNGVFVGASPDAGAEVVGSAAVDGRFFLGDAVFELRSDG